MREKAAIIVRDRESGRLIEEDVYGENALRFLYGDTFLGRIARTVVGRCAVFSALAGVWYRSRWSKKWIEPFIERFQIRMEDFAVPEGGFRSFNDFFVRKLTPGARPLAEGQKRAVIPADARYLFYPNIETADGFVVKGQKFSLEELLGSNELAKKYRRGAMVIARLCPSDYHRYHFPFDCRAGSPKRINGALYSVNPWALAQNVRILTENKRVVTEIESDEFGKALYIEIGATNVGSILQTYKAEDFQKKGSEKGYFSFGASCLILLFEEGKMEFSSDLIEGPPHQEILCKMGQEMGQSAR